MANPTLLLKNQFGEQSNNTILGGSSRLFCNFIVDPTNGNGLGIRSLKGYGVAAVFMHTSATPDPANPNPPAGYVYVQFKNGYTGYENGNAGFVSPLSGSNVNVSAGLTLHNPYVIVSVGTTTQSQWEALGLPVGTPAAVGVAFFATTASTGTGTGVVQAPSASGIDHVEIIGDPQASAGSATLAGYVLLQLMFEGLATAPAAGTVVGLTFNMHAQAGQPEE